MRNNPTVGVLGSGAILELSSHYFIAQPPLHRISFASKRLKATL